MCGISGAIGPNIDFEKIKLLGLLNEDRGGDASGIYTNKKCVKITNSYYELLKDPEYPTKVSKFVLNHARRSSSGGKIIANAQPLVVDKDVFVLNGTIKNQVVLEKVTGVTANPLDNDTAYLMRLMQNGNTDFLKYYTGGATFVYRSKNKTTFWIGETGGLIDRPLHFCYLGDTMYFSSLERDLEVIAEGSEISHFKSNSLLTMNDKAEVVTDITIDRCSPFSDLSKLQKSFLASPFNAEFTTLDSLNVSKQTITYCGGAYYYENKLFTGVANENKSGKLSWLHENNLLANYKFINGVLYDITCKPSELELQTDAFNIGIIDKEFNVIQDNLSDKMLYYSADLDAYYYNNELANGPIKPLGSDTYFHFKNGEFIKMSLYSVAEFKTEVHELHESIDNLLFEYDKEDLDMETIEIYETLQKYKEYVEGSYVEWN